MKGAVELIAAGLEVDVELRPAERPYLVRGRSAAVRGERRPTRRAIGVIGQLAPALTAARDMPLHAEVYVAEIDLDALADVASVAADVQLGASAAPPRRRARHFDHR